LPDSQPRHAQIPDASGPAAGSATRPSLTSAQRADRDVIDAIVRGDVHALASLYDRYAGELYAVTLRMLVESADAEEVVADTFTQVWRSAARYDAGRGSVAAWLVTMARSRAIDRLRARRTREIASGEVRPHIERIATDSPEREASRAEYRDHVRRALDGLAEDQRRAIDLAMYGGLSHAEIAQRLDEPLGTIKTRIRTGMQRLKAALGPLYSDEFA
jgi:RNA polymerase sigma-70 factor (ECF subfamily)